MSYTNWESKLITKAIKKTFKADKAEGRASKLKKKASAAKRRNDLH